MIKTTLLRSIAAGMGAFVGIVISLGLLIVIAVLQGLKLIGYAAWPGDQAALFVFFAAMLGFLWGFGTFRARPSVWRAVGGALAAFAAASLGVMFLRWQFGFDDPWSAGTEFVPAGFALAFGAIWGMGGFNSDYQTVETVHAAAEHPHAPGEPLVGGFDAAELGQHTITFLRERILPIVRPLLRYMVLAFGFALLGIAIVLIVILGASIFGAAHTQTNDTSASAVTPAGYLVGVTIGNQPVSKVAFFALIAVLLLGGIGTIAIGLALLVNALSAQVQIAKKAPDEPLDFSPTSTHHGPLTRAGQFMTRLAHFFTDWAADITRSVIHISR